MGRVEGKVAFITGAARGQGRSHAVRLAEEGADIIAIDICETLGTSPIPMGTEQELAETARQVEELGRRIVTAKADTRDREGLKAALDKGVAELGRLDIVCANAGLTTMQNWDEVTPEIWQDQIDVNLTGTWNTCQLTIPHLIEAGGGSIILTSSVAGLKGLPWLIPYVASKHGVVGLMKALTNELAKHMIRVNTIHPTGVDTPMAAYNASEGYDPFGMGPLLESDPSLAVMLANAMPVEITQPLDISNAVLFLASDEARYVTGLAMTVDAGATAR
jgi:SDR family mycofactocin-dependent oxidoreductase